MKQLPPIAVSSARRIGEEAMMGAAGLEVFDKTLQTANI